MTILENVIPPGVLVTQDAHVVGHDVQKQAKPVLAQSRQPRGMFVGRADLGVQHAMIGDVVAVGTAGGGLEIGRGVAVRDSQVGKVGDDGQCITEPEAGVKLDTVSGLRHSPPAGDFLERRGQQFIAVRACDRPALSCSLSSLTTDATVPPSRSERAGRMDWRLPGLHGIAGQASGRRGDFCGGMGICGLRASRRSDSISAREAGSLVSDSPRVK